MCTLDCYTVAAIAWSFMLIFLTGRCAAWKHWLDNSQIFCKMREIVSSACVNTLCPTQDVRNNKRY